MRTRPGDLIYCQDWMRYLNNTEKASRAACHGRQPIRCSNPYPLIPLGHFEIIPREPLLDLWERACYPKAIPDGLIIGFVPITYTPA